MKKKEKMLIQLDDDFRITSIPRNLVLEKRNEIEDEEMGQTRESWVVDGYYPTIQSLLKGYLRKSILLSSATNLEELANDVNRIEKKIDSYMEE